MYQRVRAERGRSLNLWLYLFGHFHCAWYCTSYALEMQYIHLKTKAQLLTGPFVCKHQVVVWNSVLSENFELIYTGKDRLRWVTFSAEKGGQLITNYSISGQLEHIYPEKQGLEKKNRMIVRRTMTQKTWRGMMQGEGMLDKIGIVHWMSLPNTPILWTTSMTSCRILPQEIYFRGSQYYKCSLVVNGWRHTVFLISKMEFQKLFETLWNPWR